MIVFMILAVDNIKPVTKVFQTLHYRAALFLGPISPLVLERLFKYFAVIRNP